MNISLQHLELFGKGYVIEHCIAFFKRQIKEQNYQIYVTDALRAIVNNTAEMFGGISMRMRYADLVEDISKGPATEETRTPEQIINHIKDKLKAL